MDDIVNVYNYHNDLSQVLVYADSVIAGLENKGRQGTAANYRSARRAFEMFLDGRPFSFEELTPEVLDRFVTFLRERGNGPIRFRFISVSGVPSTIVPAPIMWFFPIKSLSDG